MRVWLSTDNGDTHRGTMFCRAKGKLPRLSVNPATFATAKKVPDESSKSLACSLGAQWRHWGILWDTAGTKIHQVKYSAPNPSKSHPFQTCSNHPSFGVAECCHSSPECGGRGGVDCCMKTAPKRTRETSQRRSGDNTCRDIDVEVLCGPAGFHMFNCSNHLLQNTPVSRVVK